MGAGRGGGPAREVISWEAHVLEVVNPCGEKEECSQVQGKLEPGTSWRWPPRTCLPAVLVTPAQSPSDRPVTLSCHWPTPSPGKRHLETQHLISSPAGFTPRLINCSECSEPHGAISGWGKGGKGEGGCPRKIKLNLISGTGFRSPSQSNQKLLETSVYLTEHEK